MPTIEKLHFVALTRDEDYAGSDNNVQLIANLNGVDVIDHHVVSGLFLRGEALHTSPALSEAEQLRTDDGRYSFRLAITGTDLWRPEHVIVFGETADSQLFPLAGEFYTERVLSTSGDAEYGARVTMPLRHLSREFRNISRILVVANTGGFDNADTDDTLHLLITVNGEVVLNQMLPDTSQSDQEKFFANVYILNVDKPFTAPADRAAFAATLSIKGPDKWGATSFYVFGMTQEGDRWSGLFPLVHVPNMQQGPYGWLSTTESEGVNRVLLPAAW